MRIRVSRTEERRYESSAVRADGLTVTISGQGFLHRLPRHLGHFAVEDALQLRHGFWGSVMAGALLPGVRIADGQTPARDVIEKSAAITESTAALVMDARGLVASFDEIIDRHLETRWPQVDPALQSLALRRGARLVPLTKTDVARVAAAWRDLDIRWSQVPVGGALEIDWTAPIGSGAWPALKG